MGTEFYPRYCPKCKADLRGKRILKKDRDLFAGDGYFYRTIAIYDRGLDRTVAWKCPDCGNEWERK